MAFANRTKEIRMNHPIFYVDPNSIVGDNVELNKTESHHALSVMRLSVGDMIITVDGLGTAHRGEIVLAKKNKLVQLKIHSSVRNFGETDSIVTLAAGLSTNSKFDTVIEKATELGVKRIIPLICLKGKVKLDDPKRIKTKQTRYNKIALAAMKQCRRSYLPEIVAPTTFADLMKQVDDESLNLIFHPSHQSQKLSEIDFKDNRKRVTIIVGPESGFSDDELDLASDKNIISISLGDRILRTETASPSILAIIMNLLGEI